MNTRHRSTPTLATLLCLVGLLCLPLHARAVQDAEPADNIGHNRHTHKHGDPHPKGPDPTRFFTNRTGLSLDLPAEEDAFVFAVFGDRTGGPVDGVSVLADAVRDVNLLEPDFVITVGDLVNGYNTSQEWLPQMREYKGIMDELLCPWFPVAGNHDVYWRGPGKPVGEHEAEYEMHFGPLWYAFEHKNCFFIALFSDEGNPQTGEKNFEKPECNRMSEEQFTWLKETLARAKDAEHIFLFLHHPRWLAGNYGNDWEKVHQALVEAGNVTAVFGGHIHRMRYDGPRDGIEYVTLATTGGAQGGAVPQAGWLHHYDLITVRKNQVALAALPVGEVMDVREITGVLTQEASLLARMHPVLESTLHLEADGGVDGEVIATVHNPTTRPIDVTLQPISADSRWYFAPDHGHQTIQPGGSFEFACRVVRLSESLDETFRLANIALQTDYLAPGFRYEIPEVLTTLPLEVTLSAPPIPEQEMVLRLDGRGDCLRVDSDMITVPDGPLTLECWFQAESFADRVGLLAKTESSDYGFFVNNGIPGFYIHLDGRYSEVIAGKPLLEVGAWHHLAGVYDGAETRLYLDGKLIGLMMRSGTRRTNDLPLYIGADVGSRGEAVSFFHGSIDGVRLSTVARYQGRVFEPQRRHTADDSTALLLNMDAALGRWVYDESSAQAHPSMIGGARIVPAK